jgi:hypothetical protein
MQNVVLYVLYALERDTAVTFCRLDPHPADRWSLSPVAGKTAGLLPPGPAKPLVSIPRAQPNRWSLSPGPSQTAGLYILPCPTYSGRMHHGAAGMPFLKSDIPSSGREMLFTCTGDNSLVCVFKGTVA